MKKSLCLIAAATVVALAFWGARASRTAALPRPLRTSPAVPAPTGDAETELSRIPDYAAATVAGFDAMRKERGEPPPAPEVAWGKMEEYRFQSIACDMLQARLLDATARSRNDPGLAGAFGQVDAMTPEELERSAASFGLRLSAAERDLIRGMVLRNAELREWIPPEERRVLACLVAPDGSLRANTGGND